ncbi:MAG: hypothetical protein Q8N23_24200 [Archangium sp.]|nr:hypothetical protein [Archangium sp.]
MSSAVSLVALALLGGVKAQPCRPTVACTAELVPAGHVEVELGSLASGAGASINLLTKLSLLDRLQVQLGTDNFLAFDGAQLTAVDGAVAVLKGKLFGQAGWRPALSLSARIALPTRPPLPAAQGAVDLGGTVHLSKDLGWLHADLNGTVTAFSLREVQGQGALAFSTGLPANFGVALEVHSTFGNRRRPDDGGLRGVVTWSPGDRFVLDLGADLGFFRDSRAWSLFLGFVFVPTA